MMSRSFAHHKIQHAGRAQLDQEYESRLKTKGNNAAQAPKLALDVVGDYRDPTHPLRRMDGPPAL